MSIDDKIIDCPMNFIKGIEGFADNESEARLLIVLKEPNTKGKLIKDGQFWFKDQVIEKAPGTRRFYTVLGTLAKHLLNETSDQYAAALKKCAYINLYPFSGGDSAKNSNYSAVYNELKNVSFPVQTMLSSLDNASTEEVLYEYKKIAENRLGIIEKFICNGGDVLTVKEVFYQLAKHFNCQPTNYKNTRFEYFEYKGSKVYWYWHPSYSGSYRDLGAFT